MPTTTTRFKVGTTHSTKNWGNVVVLEYINKRKILVKFENCGTNRWTNSDGLGSGLFSPVPGNRAAYDPANPKGRVKKRRRTKVAKPKPREPVYPTRDTSSFRPLKHFPVYFISRDGTLFNSLTFKFTEPDEQGWLYMANNLGVSKYQVEIVLAHAFNNKSLTGFCVST